MIINEGAQNSLGRKSQQLQHLRRRRGRAFVMFAFSRVVQAGGSPRRPPPARRAPCTGIGRAGLGAARVPRALRDSERGIAACAAAAQTAGGEARGAHPSVATPCSKNFLVRFGLDSDRVITPSRSRAVRVGTLLSADGRRNKSDSDFRVFEQVMILERLRIWGLDLTES